MPSVDGGILGITRRGSPIVDPRERAGYDRFVREVFTGRGGDLAAIVQRSSGLGRPRVRRALADLGVGAGALPRDLRPAQWAGLWEAVRS
jgi:23S rRNA (adenine-N6)-dimethyltransferase